MLVGFYSRAEGRRRGDSKKNAEGFVISEEG